MNITSNAGTKVISGWIKTGVDKPIETTESRTWFNIVGAILLGFFSKAITQQYKTVNGESIIDFFDKIKKYYTTSPCVHIVLDEVGCH